MEIVATPGPHSRISAFLIEAMGATRLTAEDGRTLDGILFDRGRDHGERAAAFRSLCAAEVPADDETVVLRLLDMGDAESARLACEILATSELVDAAARTSRAATRVEPKLAGGGDMEPEGPTETGGQEPFGALETARLAALLDFISRGAPAAIAEAEAWERVALTDLARYLAARASESRSGHRAEAGLGMDLLGRRGRGSRLAGEPGSGVPRRPGVARGCHSARADDTPPGRRPDKLPGTGEDAPRSRSGEGRSRRLDGGAAHTLGERVHRSRDVAGGSGVCKIAMLERRARRALGAAEEAGDERRTPAGSGEPARRASAGQNGGDGGDDAGIGEARQAGERSYRTALSPTGRQDRGRGIPGPGVAGCRVSRPLRRSRPTGNFRGKREPGRLARSRRAAAGVSRRRLERAGARWLRRRPRTRRSAPGVGDRANPNCGRRVRRRGAADLRH